MSSVSRFAPSARTPRPAHFDPHTSKRVAGREPVSVAARRPPSTWDVPARGAPSPRSTPHPPAGVPPTDEDGGREPAGEHSPPRPEADHPRISHRLEFGSGSGLGARVGARDRGSSPHPPRSRRTPSLARIAARRTRGASTRRTRADLKYIHSLFSITHRPDDEIAPHGDHGDEGQQRAEGRELTNETANQMSHRTLPGREIHPISTVCSCFVLLSRRPRSGGHRATFRGDRGIRGGTISAIDFGGMFRARRPIGIRGTSRSRIGPRFAGVTATEPKPMAHHFVSRRSPPPPTPHPAEGRCRSDRASRQDRPDRSSGGRGRRRRPPGEASAARGRAWGSSGADAIAAHAASESSSPVVSAISAGPRRRDSMPSARSMKSLAGSAGAKT